MKPQELSYGPPPEPPPEPPTQISMQGSLGGFPEPPVDAGFTPSSIRDPDNPYLRNRTNLPVEPPPYITPPNLYGRDPRTGRPTPERLGVDPSMGGMPQERDATFDPGSVVLQRVLPTLPPIFQMFANRHIGRYSVTDIYGDATNMGGFYQGNPMTPPSGPGGRIAPTPEPTAPPTINVGRGNETGNFLAAAGPQNADAIARHELFHALAYEVTPFKEDASAQYPRLRAATRASVGALQAPQYPAGLAAQVQGFASAGDYSHVFTSLAEAVARGVRLPPALAQYFAPMLAPPPGRAPQSPPPVALLR